MWVMEVFHDATSDSFFCSGAFLLAAAAACLTLLWDQQRVYFSKTEKKGERTLCTDSKHNRMWCRVEFHSWTHVHTPNTLLHPSIFATTAKLSRFMRAVFFSVVSISDFCFPHIITGETLPAVARRCSTYTSLQLGYESTDPGGFREITQRNIGQTGRKWGKKKRACELTFYFLFCSYSSPFCPFPTEVLSHDDSLWSFPQSLRAADRWLLLPLAATRLFLTSKTNPHTTQRLWFYGLLLPPCVRLRACACVCVRGARARRAAPSPLYVTLDWNAYSQSLHCWHSAADVTRSPHSQHR